MVGIVLVSHSRPLALAVEKLVRSMTGPELPIAVAAGAGEDHRELGTDAVEISEAILSVKGPEGVLVLMDMGSALLSSETALDLLEEKDRPNIRFCAAPFVEGAVAAGVTANLGASLDEVCAEALAALKQKQAALSDEEQSSNQPAQAAPENSSAFLTSRVTIHNPHGLHARPAARLILETRLFQSEVTVRNLSKKRGPVSAKSLSLIASLEIGEGDEVEFSAKGNDAAAALEKINALAKDGFGESGLVAQPKPSLGRARPPSKSTTPGPLPISGGIAIGHGIYWHSGQLEIPQYQIENVEEETNRLRHALASTEKALTRRQAEMTAKVGVDGAAIYAAQILALQDPEWVENALRLISKNRKNAALAWSEANQEIIRRYSSLDDPYLRERAADIKDAGEQVLAHLGVEKSALPQLNQPSILVADDLSPDQVSRLPKGKVLGVILLEGGPTAHSSILLKALGLPSLVQARTIFDQTHLDQLGLIALDGTTGQIWINPSPEVIVQLQNRQAGQRERQTRETASSGQPAVTLDGRRIPIFANIGQPAEAQEAVKSGAEGVGLLRTEFLFLDRESAPTESEQIEMLRQIIATMGDRPVIVRTLDVGGDKPLPYLPMPEEENPFLGVRALRLCFSHVDIFRTQLRAILLAGLDHDLRIMFPMVADPGDLLRARTFLQTVHAQLVEERLPHLWPIKIGIMIEIPSAALQAESLAAQVDFFSIGTNDLTQYTLAADRGNPALSAYQSALHPAVLRLVHQVVVAARNYQRPVAVCGEAASDMITASILVGLGVEELSMSAHHIPRLKAALRSMKVVSLELLAERALQCDSAAEVQNLTQDALKDILA